MIALFLVYLYENQVSLFLSRIYVIMCLLPLVYSCYLLFSISVNEDSAVTPTPIGSAVGR